MAGRRSSYNFIDLFAGAGGFSEGFLQCEHNGKSLNFVLASDVNENAELTHVMRYNKQLGMDVDFLRKDITEKDFLENLDEKLDNKVIDVVCGGPPCQSFSLAGRRWRHDMRDYLFRPFLAVVEHLKPKYFVMENVSGILSKQGGKLVGQILRSIRSITDSGSKRTRLYRIEKPILVNASDYGVPQERNRVLFIGCRNDQEIIIDIPPTTREKKVTVLEALHDLEGVGNGDALLGYLRESRRNLPKRLADGRQSSRRKTYAEWSRKGRLVKKLKRRLRKGKLAYAKDFNHVDNPKLAELQNHQSPSHSENIRKRYRIIRKYGGYEESKRELERRGLLSSKKNYKLLRKNKPSPTVMTIPDDLIHYSSDRTLTVRELARLQSFDDSFVFQGNRTTGGVRRGKETPQYTLVGNAVPPLLARAIGTEIVKKIE